MRQRYLNSVSKEVALKMWLESFPLRALEGEVVATNKSLGRVTARPVRAVQSSPHYAASAMDGIAVLARDTVHAAPLRPVRLEIGLNCSVVDTGDPLPQGSDAVIMIENVVIEGTSCYIEQSVAPFTNVRPVGEDIVAGEILLPRFRHITPVDMGALLAAGVGEVAVLAKPRVTIIPTGDEMVPPGSVLKQGDVVEYNSAIISGEVELWGGQPIVLAPVADDAKLLSKAVEEAATHSDIILIIAGSSTGRGDFTVEVLEKIGTVLVHGVAMRPGKPVILAKVGSAPVVGLPGYPVSMHLCLETFVKPLLFAYNRQPLPSSVQVEGVLTRRLVSPFGVEEQVRVQAGCVGGQVIVTPLGRGAGVVSSLMRADGLVTVPAQSEGLAEGEVVSVTLRRPPATINDTLVCIGSHDLALDVLADILRVSEDMHLQTSHVGSMGGLLSLKRNFAHLATTHLLDETSGKYNIDVVRRLFPDEDMVIVNLVERWQGFIHRWERAISGWQDLTKGRFVNRQRGAGTRALLDYHLKLQGIEPRDIEGYGREESTHLAVACAVDAGSADVGLGILSAAENFGLSFTPLCLEQFDIVLRRDSLSDPRVVALLRVVRSPEFAARVGELGGYETKMSGEVVWSTHAR